MSRHDKKNRLISSAPGLPAGLTINPNTGVIIAGAGDYNPAKNMVEFSICPAPSLRAALLPAGVRIAGDTNVITGTLLYTGGQGDGLAGPGSEGTATGDGGPESRSG